MEYWMFLLGNFLVNCAIAVLHTSRTSAASSRSSTASRSSPESCVTVRRLHDTGRSAGGSFSFGAGYRVLVLLYFMVLDSQPGDNAYVQIPRQLLSRSYSARNGCLAQARIPS